MTVTEKSLFASCYFLFFVNGGLALMLGAVMPYMKNTYGIDYALAGILISVHSIGNLVSSFIGGIIPIYIGRKKSILLLCSAGFIAFILMSFYGNPFLLLLAFFLTGICRGAISNFNNTVINTIATGKAWALNLLHAVFAIGAFTSPFVALFFTRNNAEHWKYATLSWALFCFLELVVLFMMDIPNNRPAPKQNRKVSWDFLKNKNYIIACAILFFYLSSEQAINGWLVTYFKDSGIMSDTFAQTMASLLWLVILLGRLVCAYISEKVQKPKLLVYSSIGYLLFFVVLLFSKQLLPITIGIVGIGFCMSGLYPTTLADIGDVLKQYPLALSFILTIAGLGAIIMPAIIGTVADHIGIIGGMSVIIVSVAFTLLFIFINAFNRRTTR
jgi:fucose permease